MDRLSRFLVSLRISPRRAVLVEALLVAPAALLIAFVVVTWIWYYRLADQVQHIAEAALAAAQAAPDERAREPAARAAADAECYRQGLAPRILEVSLSRRTHELSLQLAYDASAAPAFALASIMPLPSGTIVRLARTAIATKPAAI